MDSKAVMTTVSATGDALPTKLLKTVSSPTALNLTVSRQATPIPPLSQIGKQTSVNFRYSQLYDSGAESADADEQTRLIRSPSSRSHKFIIIPSTQRPGAGSANAVGPPFRQTISNSSLTTLAAALQKPPFFSATMQQQFHQEQQSAQTSQQFTRQLSAASASSATPLSYPFVDYIDASPSSVAASPLQHQQQHQQQQQQQHEQCSPSPSGASTPPKPVHHSPPSDVPHQLETESAMASQTSNATGASDVTFTIEDCETDNAPDAAAVEQHHNQHATVPLHTMDPLISSINSAPNITHSQPSATSSTPSELITSASNAVLAIATSSPLPQYPSAVLINSHTVPACPAAPRVDLRPRTDRTSSSMRSVVSAYLPVTVDAIQDSNHPYHGHILQPTTSFDGKDLSSYIFHDQVANQIYSDVTSVRSLASIGIGSTDGRKLVIRRVPHTPTELFTMVNPSPPPGIEDDDDDSFLDTSDETAHLKPRQQHWGNKMQFVLACIGYSVGLGNVWRFPYMCYKSGGGVFLVPYCIILIICSIPLLFMELSVGQYTGRGPIGALGQLCPLFKGAGLASVVVSFLMSTYYSVIIGYSIYYFFTSFRPFMPWVDCSNRWNTPDCWVPQRKNNNMTAPDTSRTPSEEFFENKVLQISPGIEYPGLMRWELFACLICAWLMVYFATWKSIKSSAKVRYFTATFPFVLIIILLGRAVTLEGANEGLRFFFRPNWSELKNANVWINAASQNFNSLGITFGSMISFASYNKYNNNILHDTIAVSIVNILTSLLVGVFAFATLGNLALEQNTNVKDVIGDGPGLIFVVYPQAMAKMPYAQLWAVMFFFMLLCLGLNSQFAIVEVVVTSIQDGFPNWIKRNLGYHEIVVLFVCVISFLFGLPNLIQGGIYFFQLMDHYAASISIMFLAFCQMIAIAWFYGTGRLSKNVKQMTGKAPSLYLKSCWILLGPCLLFAIWILSLINYKEPSYHNGRYKYPDWAYGIGWMFTSFSLVCIPGYAVINIIRSPGSSFWERFRNNLRPNIYECRICGEHHCEHDFPEQEQYMLAQELSGIYKPIDQMKPSSPEQQALHQMPAHLVVHTPEKQSHAQQQPNEQTPSTSATAAAAAAATR